MPRLPRHPAATAATSPTPYAPQFNLDSFAQIVVDPLYAAALWLSIKVAGLSTLICLLAGYPMALAIARATERRRNLLLMALMLPFWTGFLMRINAWIGLLQDGGWVNSALLAAGITAAPLQLLYTDAAMYLGMVYTYLPFMVLPLYARLSRLDPVLLEAAADLGAGPLRAFPRLGDGDPQHDRGRREQEQRQPGPGDRQHHPACSSAIHRASRIPASGCQESVTCSPIAAGAPLRPSVSTRVARRMAPFGKRLV